MKAYSEPNAPARYYNVQILRAIAAAAVLVDHASATTAGIFPGSAAHGSNVVARFDYGVPVFFAISGFVLTHAIQADSIPRFLLARALRIYPGFWLAIALTLLIEWGTTGRTEWSPGAWSTLTLLPLGPTPRLLGGVEWTLVYEIFFYTLFALMWASRSRQAVLVFCAGWLLSIALAGLYDPARYTVTMPRGTTIALSAYNLPFIFGMLAYHAHSELKRRQLPALGLACAALWVAGGFVESAEIRALVIGLASGSLVMLFGRLAREHDASRNSWLVRCGDCSYGIYLLHLAILGATVRLVDLARFGAWGAFTVLVVVAFAGACAFGALENRLYRLLKRTALSRLRGTRTSLG
jgi:peptidoglycan/LPS O-acetylase OafA/YrhL